MRYCSLHQHGRRDVTWKPRMRGGVVSGTVREICCTMKSWQLMLQTKIKQTQTYFLIDQKFFIEIFVLQSLIYSQTPASPLMDPMLQ